MVVLAVVAVGAVLKNMYALPKMPVYLVDFSVHKGLDEWRFSKDMFVPLSRETGVSGGGGLSGRVTGRWSTTLAATASREQLRMGAASSSVRAIGGRSGSRLRYEGKCCSQQHGSTFNSHVQGLFGVLLTCCCRSMGGVFLVSCSVLMRMSWTSRRRSCTAQAWVMRHTSLPVSP